MGRPKQRYAIAWVDLWSDDGFLDLSTEARLLFIWAWTNPEAAICGLYRASKRQLAEALGLDVAGDDTWADDERLGGALAELARKPMMVYDERTECLWVINRCRYTLKESKGNERAVDAMVREVKAAPRSPLVEDFLERYGEQLGLALART